MHTAQDYHLWNRHELNLLFDLPHVQHSLMQLCHAHILWMNSVFVNIYRTLLHNLQVLEMHGLKLSIHFVEYLIAIVHFKCTLQVLHALHPFFGENVTSILL